MKRSSNTGGFTLLEILTVIAITALLFALLFPVFVSARHKARETQCVSQMRQIVTALNIYRQDYDGGESGTSYVDMGLPKNALSLITSQLIMHKSIFLCPNRFIKLTGDDPRILSHYDFYNAYNVSYSFPTDPSRNVFRSTNFAAKYAEDSSFPAVCCEYHDITYYHDDAKRQGGPLLLGVGLNGTLNRRKYYEVYPPEHPVF